MRRHLRRAGLAARHSVEKDPAMFSTPAFVPLLQWLAALLGLQLAGSLWLLAMIFGDTLRAAQGRRKR